MKSKHRKTRKSYDIDGDAHFLTFSCFKRLPLFSKERSCEWMVMAIRLAKSKNPFELWAWVAMPEHVHLVILPHTKTTIASILKSMKQSVANRAMIWLKDNSPEFLTELEDLQPNGKRSFRFWQRGGGYDRNLRSVKDIHEKINYVHNNPVKRGLVTKAAEWRWSSARAWETGSDEPLGIDRDSVPFLTNLNADIRSNLFS